MSAAIMPLPLHFADTYLLARVANYDEKLLLSLVLRQSCPLGAKTAWHSLLTFLSQEVNKWQASKSQSDGILCRNLLMWIQDNNGATALHVHVASHNGHKDTVELLINANVNDDNGVTHSWHSWELLKPANHSYMC